MSVQLKDFQIVSRVLNTGNANVVVAKHLPTNKHYIVKSASLSEGMIRIEYEKKTT